jgi:hypothetical protein
MHELSEELSGARRRPALLSMRSSRATGNDSMRHGGVGELSMVSLKESGEACAAAASQRASARGGQLVVGDSHARSGEIERGARVGSSWSCSDHFTLIAAVSLGVAVLALIFPVIIFPGSKTVCRV